MEDCSGFDWDDGNRAKCQKHGVSLEEIEGLFARSVMIRPDIAHSIAETRFLAIGRGPAGRYLLIAFTIRENKSPQSAPGACIGRRSNTMKKPIPDLKTDDDAADFVETADLTEYDLSGFKPARFEFQPKASQLNMRLPTSLLDAVRARAADRGIPYTRYVRETLEHAVAEPPVPKRR
jgi:predicted DNA binding CopG/RHH family protein/uncharacterized DUF497 family protein